MKVFVALINDFDEPVYAIVERTREKIYESIWEIIKEVADMSKEDFMEDPGDALMNMSHMFGIDVETQDI